MSGLQNLSLEQAAVLIASRVRVKQADKNQPVDAALGPLQHAYVADAVGAQAHGRAAQKILDTAKPDDGKYSQLFQAMAPVNKTISERVHRGAVNLAESPKHRLLSLLDPTRDGRSEGLVGMTAGLGSTDISALSDIVAQRYASKLKKYQDRVDPDGIKTERETPWHIAMQGQLADKDSDIAGHRYMRNERPWQYWMNPLGKAGPLSELGDRAFRRSMAGAAYPESTTGRALASLPGVGLLMGGEAAQQKLRRSAYDNDIYADVAKPEVQAPEKTKTATVRVKQAVESTTKPEYSQTLQQPVTQPDAPRYETSPAGGEPGIMDKVRAALSNIDFGSLANKGMDAAKGFSPISNPLHAALLGGGLGMGVGALGSLTSSDKEKRKRWLRNALFGGAMGGIGGYGAHAAFNYGKDLRNAESARQKAEMEKPQVPMVSERIAHTAANPRSTVVGGLVGGVAGHTAGKMYDRYKDNKAVAGIIGSKGFKPHLDAANAKMRRAGTPEITQAQVDQFGRASTAMPWQTLFGGKGAPHLVATSEVTPPTPQASASRAVIPYNAAQAAKAQAAQPVPPVASFTAKSVRDRVSYRKPKLTAEQTGPLMEGYGHYTAKKPVVRKRPFGLGGVGGTVLGAALGAGLTAAGTPHLSQAQKQQQAPTP